MDDDLITKKDLLAQYGISYGALYRWKRMGLIPENWFIKRSVATGQETYFDRAAITERIEAILAMKDTLSLDEIAEHFRSPEKKRRMAQPTLKLVWQRGEKNIGMDEIDGIYLISSVGETVDITEKIQKISTEAFGNE